MIVRLSLLLFAVAAAGLLTVDGGNAAYGCSCIGPKPIEEEFDEVFGRSAAVFSGTVTEIKADQFGKMVALDVEMAWKGVSKSPAIVTTAANSAACGYPFEEGGQYLVYAYGGDEDSSLKVNSCDRTTPVEGAERHLALLGEGDVPERANVGQPTMEQPRDQIWYVDPWPALIGAGAGVAGAVAVVTLWLSRSKSRG